MNKLIQFSICEEIKLPLIEAISEKNGYKDTITVGIPDTDSPNGNVLYTQEPNPETKEDFVYRILEDKILLEYTDAVVYKEASVLEKSKRVEIDSIIEAVKQKEVV